MNDADPEYITGWTDFRLPPKSYAEITRKWYREGGIGKPMSGIKLRTAFQQVLRRLLPRD